MNLERMMRLGRLHAKSGGGSSGTTTVSNELPPEIRPLASQISNLSIGALSNSPAYQGIARSFGPSVIPQPDYNRSFAFNQFNRLGNLGVQNLLGPELTDASQRQLTQTARGDFLFGGPMMNAVMADVRERIPQVTSQFAGAGRLNSGLAEAAVSSEVADAMARRFGEERTNQMRAAGLAPMLAQQDVADIGGLERLGRSIEADQRERLQENAARFQFAQEEPRFRTITEPLQQAGLAPGLGQFGGSQTSQTFGGGPGGFQSAIGGGLLGGTLGAAGQNFLTSNFALPGSLAALGTTFPYGALIGGGLGILGGLFS